MASILSAGGWITASSDGSIPSVIRLEHIGNFTKYSAVTLTQNIALWVAFRSALYSGRWLCRKASCSGVHFRGGAIDDSEKIVHWESEADVCMNCARYRYTSRNIAIFKPDISCMIYQLLLFAEAKYISVYVHYFCMMRWVYQADTIAQI